MNSPTIEDLEKEAQSLIEKNLTDEDWIRAYGEVEAQPSDGGDRRIGRHYYTKPNRTDEETLVGWPHVEGVLEELRIRNKAQRCKYALQRGGKIQFDYTNG